MENKTLNLDTGRSITPGLLTQPACVQQKRNKPTLDEEEGEEEVNVHMRQSVCVCVCVCVCPLLSYLTCVETG